MEPPKSRLARLCETLSSLLNLFNRAKPTIDKMAATAAKGVEEVKAGNINAAVATAGDMVTHVTNVDEKIVMELRQVQENLSASVEEIPAIVEEVKAVMGQAEAVLGQAQGQAEAVVRQAEAVLGQAEAVLGQAEAVMGQAQGQAEAAIKQAQGQAEAVVRQAEAAVKQTVVQPSAI